MYRFILPSVIAAVLLLYNHEARYILINVVSKQVPGFINKTKIKSTENVNEMFDNRRIVVEKDGTQQGFRNLPFVKGNGKKIYAFFFFE